MSDGDNHYPDAPAWNQYVDAFSERPRRGDLAVWLIEKFADYAPSDMPWLPHHRRWAALAALRASELLLGLPIGLAYRLHAERRRGLAP